MYMCIYIYIYIERERDRERERERERDHIIIDSRGIMSMYSTYTYHTYCEEFFLPQFWGLVFYCRRPSLSMSGCLITKCY